ncbi:MAG: hypothetical protein HOP10_02105 [Chitinophagaceae bacterium]|nr:hypothetical protein [Chitinophagaceae bacterium]
MTNTRRKFLVQGSMLTTALVAAKPFDALATLASPFTGEGFNQVTLLHTALPATAAASRLGKIKHDHANPVLLGVNSSEEEQSANYDAAAGYLPQHFDGTYKIIHKGQFRIAVIETAPGEGNNAETVNHLAAFLKKDENCDLVVCISQLGFKNRSSIDDIRLAERSENLDIIIGRRSAASPKRPYISLNKKRAEVILQYADDQETAIGKIKIVFDKKGDKHGIEFRRFRSEEAIA